MGEQLVNINIQIKQIGLQSLWHMIEGILLEDWSYCLGDLYSFLDEWCHSWGYCTRMVWNQSCRFCLQWNLVTCHHEMGKLVGQLHQDDGQEVNFCKLKYTMQGDTFLTEWYISNGHSVNLRLRLTSSDWLKVDFLDTWFSGSRYIIQWKAVVHWPSAVRCISCHWTTYPKINFQPIRICLKHTQIRRMTVGHVSFCWT